MMDVFLWSRSALPGENVSVVSGYKQQKRCRRLGEAVDAKLVWKCAKIPAVDKTGTNKEKFCFPAV